MRSHVRTIIVLAVAVALIALFLNNVDLWRVLASIMHAQPEWLALSVATMLVNLAIRALRWQYLLEPLGHTSFMSSFRATAVGFAASSVLPARAGEVIRPYFLARQAPPDQKGRMTATGAFATIILERLLDMVTVLILLASFVFVFGKNLAGVNPTGFALVKWAGASAAAISITVLAVLFVLAGDPARLGRTMARLE
jgi:glycosyltransferase 2 family protein